MTEQIKIDSVIHGVTDANIGLPREGFIKLGTKAEKDLPYFGADAENRDRFETGCGKEPKTLDISFPCNDPHIFAKQNMSYRYVREGQKARTICYGDNRNAKRYDQEDGTPRDVVCNFKTCEFYGEGKPCRKTLTLQVHLLNVGFGVWEVSTTSGRSFKNINGFLYLLGRILRRTGGNLEDIPFVLSKEPYQSTIPGSTTSTTKYALKISFNGTRDELREAIAQNQVQSLDPPLLPPPEEMPMLSPSAVVEAPVIEAVVEDIPPEPVVTQAPPPDTSTYIPIPQAAKDEFKHNVLQDEGRRVEATEFYDHHKKHEGWRGQPLELSYPDFTKFRQMLDERFDELKI